MTFGVYQDGGKIGARLVVTDSGVELQVLTVGTAGSLT